LADAVVENDRPEGAVAARSNDGERERVMPVGHRDPDVVTDVGRGVVRRHENQAAERRA
jgi:hypothetical protein